MRMGLGRMGGEEEWRRVVWAVFVRGSWQVFELFACLFGSERSFGSNSLLRCD